MGMRSGFLQAVVVACLALLSACSGDGGESGGDQTDEPPVTDAPPETPPAEQPSDPTYPTFSNAAAELYGARPEFTFVDPSAAQENSLRSQHGLPPACDGSANASCGRASTYRLQNIHHAHTATLPDGQPVTGEGTLIAIIDDGFRTTHQELSGKSIIRFLGNTSALGIDSHGTAVASIAAGKANGRGMMGVAPDANLHLASWQDVSGAGLVRHLAAATDDAARLGAVVQNNSWTWSDEERADTEAENFAAAGTADYAAFIATQQGGSASDWRALFSAYDDFQETGVVVVANSNNPDLGDATAWAALPNFVPELSEAWIATSNALFTVDSETDAILSAELLSAPCGSAAPYCLIASGSMNVPSAGTNSSYIFATGTSFTAPQISGGIALLAQAFPNLSPSEWTMRLLATAQRDWAGFSNSTAGEIQFGPGVHRAYSRLYGHGVPDIKAALSPVGGLSIVTGESVYSGSRSAIENGVAMSGPIVGNAIAKALSGRKLMVVDRLGADFYIKGGELKGAKRKRVKARWKTNAQHFLTSAQRLDYAFASVPMAESAAIALRNTAQMKLFFSHGFAAADSGLSFSRVMTLEANDYLQFSGWMDRRTDTRAGGFTVSRLATRENFTSELSFSAGQGDEQLFGADSSGPFLAADASSNFSVGYGFNIPTGLGWSLSGFAELGSGFATEAPDTLIDYDALAYAGGGFALNKRGFVWKGDTVGLYLGVRPAAIAGQASIRLPVGRSRDGTISYERIGIDLNEADVPLRLGLAHHTRTASDFDWRFNANVDFEAGNTDGAVLDLAAGLRKEF